MLALIFINESNVANAAIGGHSVFLAKLPK